MDPLNAELSSQPTINKPWVIGFGVAALLSFALMLGVFRAASVPTGGAAPVEGPALWIRAAGGVTGLMQQVQGVQLGRAGAFEGVVKAQGELDPLWAALATEPNPEEGAVKSRWTELLPSLSVLGETQKKGLVLQEAAGTVQKQLVALQKLQEQLVTQLLPQPNATGNVVVVTRQSWLAERLMGHVQVLLDNPSLGLDNGRIDRLEKDMGLFGQIIQALEKGNSSLHIEALVVPQDVESLNTIKQQYKTLQDTLKTFSEAVKASAQTQQLTDSLLQSLQQLNTQMLTQAQKGAAVGVAQKSGASGWGTVLGLLSLGFFSASAWRAYHDLRRVTTTTVMQHKANRAAVWRLLDELSTLAEGDLTVEATVGEDITGSIAESVNFAIHALRRLVETIESTVKEVLESAESAQSMAHQLAEASAHQAQEIVGASAVINAIAHSIEGVSAHAQQSSAVAEDSVQSAQKGAAVVQDNRQGMERVQIQMEETAKKIKQLGGRSQEIGDIISIIADITDQTHVLALNAAIQAAMAGEAGRGFAVVADEVQRLAERSSQSAKQIESLVHNIQKETAETVSSMQETAQEVEAANQLANNAADALTRIEAVSKELAEHMQQISGAAQEQAEGSAKASNTMQVIQEITTQTASGSASVASTVGTLRQLTQALKSSVAGFKLPEKK